MRTFELTPPLHLLLAHAHILIPPPNLRVNLIIEISVTNNYTITTTTISTTDNSTIPTTITNISTILK